MKIECPKCSTTNEIDTNGVINCSECNSSLSDYIFKKCRTSLWTATTLLALGGYGTYKAETYLETPRYPIQVEYELIDNCVNSSSNSRSFFYQTSKTKICICALRNTMEDVTYSEMKENESLFVTHFKNNVSKCD